MLLEVEDLNVEINGRRVLKNVNLSVGFGETILLLGPNGSGKTSLIQTIIGNPKYHVKSGRIKFMGKDITHIPSNERLKLGLSVSYQFPPKIRGVSVGRLLEEMKKKFSIEDEWVNLLLKRLNVSEFLNHNLHSDMSGGESKRLELFFTLLTKPHLILLDEPDSGIDVENLSLIGNFLNKFLMENRVEASHKRSALIVTHLGTISKYLMVDRAYVLMDGEIICYGRAYEILRGIMEHGFDKCPKCFRVRK
ncbi:MAG TPA: ATP-binding cassette domain-containing protein [Candidatus Bathyarchaeota archaeon]|nr:ATP-binding cassette domain-containing protein [Candidatus Bathyarchaeota archaeon]